MVEVFLPAFKRSHCLCSNAVTLVCSEHAEERQPVRLHGEDQPGVEGTGPGPASSPGLLCTHPTRLWTGPLRVQRPRRTLPVLFGRVAVLRQPPMISLSSAQGSSCRRAWAGRGLGGRLPQPEPSDHLPSGGQQREAKRVAPGGVP